MTSISNEEVEKLAVRLDRPGLVFTCHDAARYLRTLLTERDNARRKAFEEAAKWYVEKGWLLDEDDVPDAIRGLNDLPPAPTTGDDHDGE